MLCATTFEIHGHNFKVRPVYNLCDFCVETFEVTEAQKVKEIFGLNQSWRLAMWINGGEKRLKELKFASKWFWWWTMESKLGTKKKSRISELIASLDMVKELVTDINELKLMVKHLKLRLRCFSFSSWQGQG